MHTCPHAYNHLANRLGRNPNAIVPMSVVEEILKGGSTFDESELEGFKNALNSEERGFFENLTSQQKEDLAKTNIDRRYRKFKEFIEKARSGKIYGSTQRLPIDDQDDIDGSSRTAST